MALVALVCRFCLALLLGTAGLAKIASTDEFAESVSAFGVANRRRGRIVAVWLPRLELAASVTLLAGIGVPVVAAASAALLVAFTATLVRALRRGRKVSCGCFGFGSARPIGWDAVARNLVLIVAAAIVAGYGPEAMTLAPVKAVHATSASTADAAVALVSSLAGLLVGALTVSVVRVRSAATRLLAKGVGAS